MHGGLPCFRRFSLPPQPSATTGRRKRFSTRGACCADVRADAHGNVIRACPARRPAASLAGHCDEIGLIVRYIDDDGYLFSAPLRRGPYAFGAARADVRAEGRSAGVIGPSPTICRIRKKWRGDQLHELWIDIGAGNRETANASRRRPPPSGARDSATLGGLASARDFDDKAGEFTVLETLRRWPPPLRRRLSP
jgi:endoglucanase